MINFKGAFKNLEATQNLEIMDLAEAVALTLPTESGENAGSGVS